MYARKSTLFALLAAKNVSFEREISALCRAESDHCV
jgi:hypothetical protein